MQKVGVDGERRLALLVLGDRNLVPARELEEFLAALEVPLAPGRDDADAGLERVIGELESHLVVALAGGAVADGIGASQPRDLDLLLGDERARDRGTEQVHALVERVRPEHREHVVADELLAQILDEDVLTSDAEQLRLFARGLELLALAEVGSEGHDLAAVGLLQPLEDDGRIEPPRIGEHGFLDFRSARLAGCRGSHGLLGSSFEKRGTIGLGLPAARIRAARRAAQAFGHKARVEAYSNSEQFSIISPCFCAKFPLDAVTHVA